VPTSTIPPIFFLQAGCPSCRPTNSVKALMLKNKLTQKFCHLFHHFIQLCCQLPISTFQSVHLLQKARSNLCRQRQRLVLLPTQQPVRKILANKSIIDRYIAHAVHSNRPLPANRPHCLWSEFSRFLFALEYCLIFH